ncbi:hypothetical protein NHX12_009438 [Muraenolepis orangiensis]|uniref:Uncharacterized protein n=1 Tax=Muraenolepis orangiensis TaxID=630683 RepID=A0A9Q0DNB2_9TELE|nr:hypothetical protein NHX12_009438 [Muraenolepis orangiensis]
MEAVAVGADHVTSYMEGGLVPLRSRQQVPHCTFTEMRDNFCQPKLHDELQDKRFITSYGCNKHNPLHCRGIVPTVVQRHIRDHRHVSELTTYDTFYSQRSCSSYAKCCLKRPA